MRQQYCWSTFSVTLSFPTDFLQFLKFISFILKGVGFDSELLCIRKAGTLLLEPHLQSILLQLFWGQCIQKYLSGLASNLYPSNLSRIAVRATSAQPNWLFLAMLTTCKPSFRITFSLCSYIFMYTSLYIYMYMYICVCMQCTWLVYVLLYEKYMVI
jgi:hypothetical protein